MADAQRRDWCFTGARLALAAAIVAIVASVGCGGSSASARDAGMEATPGDTVASADGGSDTAGSDTGGGGGADADTHCVATGFGCRCSPGDDGTLQTCSAASVSDGGASGFCCQDQNECDCQRIECHTRVADAYCTCTGPVQMTGTLGTSCDSLQASNPSVICCLDAASCTCSTQQCSFVGQQVSSCNADRIAIASCNGAPMVDSCR
jgi:hypothetical protein